MKLGTSDGPTDWPESNDATLGTDYDAKLLHPGVQEAGIELRTWNLPCRTHTTARECSRRSGVPQASSYRQVQWMQNNSEPDLRHSKRGRKDGKGKGEQHGKGSAWECSA